MEIVCPVLGAYKQTYPVVIGTAQANHRVAKARKARASATMGEVAWFAGSRRKCVPRWAQPLARGSVCAPLGRVMAGHAK
jgi:hypothetical protein